MTAYPQDPAEPSRLDLLAQLTTLKDKFANLAAIEQAKGALMAVYGLTADAAFDLLRFHSQTQNVKLRAIAAQLTSLLSTSPTSSEAITRFDRLIDNVTCSLQTTPSGLPEVLATSPLAGMASLWSDIAADQQLQAAGQAVATAPPGITIGGNAPNFPLVYANDRFAELTGYPVGDVLGRNCRFLQGAATDPRDIATLSRALHAGRDCSVVMQNYRSDGSVFSNQVSISPIRNPINQITHYIGTQIAVVHHGEPSFGHQEKPAGRGRSPRLDTNVNSSPGSAA